MNAARSIRCRLGFHRWRMVESVWKFGRLAALPYNRCERCGVKLSSRVTR